MRPGTELLNRYVSVVKSCGSLETLVECLTAVIEDDARGGGDVERERNLLERSMYASHCSPPARMWERSRICGPSEPVPGGLCLVCVRTTFLNSFNFIPSQPMP
jgi:hypothetical protein